MDLLFNKQQSSLICFCYFFMQYHQLNLLFVIIFNFFNQFTMQQLTGNGNTFFFLLINIIKLYLLINFI